MEPNGTQWEIHRSSHVPPAAPVPMTFSKPSFHARRVASKTGSRDCRDVRLGVPRVVKAYKKRWKIIISNRSIHVNPLFMAIFNSYMIIC